METADGLFLLFEEIRKACAQIGCNLVAVALLLRELHLQIGGFQLIQGVEALALVGVALDGAIDQVGFGVVDPSAPVAGKAAGNDCRIELFKLEFMWVSGDIF